MSVDLFQRLISDNDQDRAHADFWWKDTSDEAKLMVLAAITKHYDDPVMEAMSRFAQLGFGETAERNHREAT